MYAFLGVYFVLRLMARLVGGVSFFGAEHAIKKAKVGFRPKNQTDDCHKMVCGKLAIKL